MLLTVSDTPCYNVIFVARSKKCGGPESSDSGPLAHDSLSYLQSHAALLGSAVPQWLWWNVGVPERSHERSNVPLSFALLWANDPPPSPPSPSA